MPNLEDLIRNYSINTVIIASAALLILTVLANGIKKPSENLKKLLFGLFVFAILAPTIFLSGSTIYLNTVSSSKGPVHWHADIEIYECGMEVNLKDPKGLSNKIGTATLHEHNDKRIHLEGVVVEPEDASLGKFFNVIGGSLSKDKLVVPTNEGTKDILNETDCPDEYVGYLQAFLFKTVGGKFIQQKLENPEEYIISPHSQVPPGDCIIFEVDREKEKTDKICLSYKVAEELGKISK